MSMNSSEAQHDIWHMALLWFEVSYLMELRGRDRSRLQRIAAEASDLAEQHPLQCCPEMQFLVPAYSQQKKLSGGEVAALMVVCLWLLHGEREDLCGSLLDGFPELRDALQLAPKEEGGQSADAR
jgi:hypothetical protein